MRTLILQQLWKFSAKVDLTYQDLQRSSDFDKTRAETESTCERSPGIFAELKSDFDSHTMYDGPYGDPYAKATCTDTSNLQRDSLTYYFPVNVDVADELTIYSCAIAPKALVHFPHSNRASMWPLKLIIIASTQLSALTAASLYTCPSGFSMTEANGKCFCCPLSMQMWVNNRKVPSDSFC